MSRAPSGCHGWDLDPCVALQVLVVVERRRRRRRRKNLGLGPGPMTAAGIKTRTRAVGASSRPQGDLCSAARVAVLLTKASFWPELPDAGVHMHHCTGPEEHALCCDDHTLFCLAPSVFGLPHVLATN